MMKSRYFVSISGILALFISFEAGFKAVAEVTEPPPLGAKSADQKPTQHSEQRSAQASNQWSKKMQELYKILAEITTDTSSDRRFNAPENKIRIERNTKKLADRAHDLSKTGAFPDSDPTVKILADLFQDETKRAYWALKSGHRPYARTILNQVSSYCIACHTRNDSGPSFSSLPLEPIAKNLLPIEQGRFFAATRQYDRALNLFQKIVNDPALSISRPIEWEQAVRYGLAISVRVKKDPNQALALVERVISAKKAPFFLRQDALKWKESLLKWKEELPRRALTEEGLFSEAKQLIVQARALQDFPMDHASDVLYLRATAVIHELLQKAPDGRHAQEALLMAGLCYEALRPLRLEDIHEIYYEACIRKTPHTPTAANCYQRYEQSTYEGYTGSEGTYLPEDLKLKLKKLEKLALPESSSEFHLD